LKGKQSLAKARAKLEAKKENKSNITLVNKKLKFTPKNFSSGSSGSKPNIVGKNLSPATVKGLESKGFEVKKESKVTIVNKTLPQLENKQTSSKKVLTGKPQSTLTAVPKPKGRIQETFSRFSRQADRFRTEKEKSQARGGFSFKQEAKQVATGFGLGIASAGLFAQSLFTNPKETTKAVGTGLKNVGSNIISGRGFPSLGKAIRDRPSEVLGRGAAELLLAKGTGTVIRGSARVSEVVGTVASPKFRPVRTTPSGKAITNIPSKDPSRGVLDIKVSGSISKDLAEPIKTQTKLAGTEQDLVSGARDLFGTFRRREIVIDKPKPTPQSPELERAFFTDPRGRLRPSRLGLVGDQPKAKLIDILSGDVTLKRSKPQAILFEREKISKFPKGLRAVEKKLKRGKTLSPREEKRLEQFQLKPTGKFKVPGFLSVEPEAVLAPGEVIRREGIAAVTLIKGRRVPVIRAKVVKDSKKSKLNLFLESKNPRLKSQVSSRDVRRKPLFEVSRPISSASVLRKTPSVSRFIGGSSGRKTSPLPRGSSPFPRPPLRSPPLRSPPLRSPPLRSPPLRSPPLRSPPLRSPPLRSPPLRPPVFSPPRPPARPPFKFKPFKKPQRKPKTKQKLDRVLKYQPSLVAVEGKIRGKKRKDLSGLEVRPLNY